MQKRWEHIHWIAKLNRSKVRARTLCMYTEPPTSKRWSANQPKTPSRGVNPVYTSWPNLRPSISTTTMTPYQQRPPITSDLENRASSSHPSWIPWRVMSFRSVPFHSMTSRTISYLYNDIYLDSRLSILLMLPWSPLSVGWVFVPLALGLRLRAARRVAASICFFVCSNISFA